MNDETNESPIANLLRAQAAASPAAEKPTSCYCHPLGGEPSMLASSYSRL